MLRKELHDTLKSYFRYFGDDAAEIIDDIEPLDQSRIVQNFIDAVEEDLYEVAELSDGDYGVYLDQQIPADIRGVLQLLLKFYILDKRITDEATEFVKRSKINLTLT